MLKRLNVPLLASVAMLVSVPYLMSNAADETKPTAASAPATATAQASPISGLTEITDPAFDKHVDILLVGYAWDQMDAGLMTDCALQLAEGERILMRKHKAISSQQLLAIATKVAADNRDSGALDRLAQVGEATKNTSILQQVASAKKLAGQSRKIDPALTISAVEVSPTQLAIYQEAVNGTKAATLVGDKAFFKNLEDALNDKESMLASLTDSQRAYLKKVMGESREIMPKESSQELSDTLAKLKDASRGNLGFGVGSIVHGINDLKSGHKSHGISSIINGIGHVATSGNNYNYGGGYNRPTYYYGGGHSYGHGGNYQYGHNYGHNYNYNPYGHNNHGHHTYGHNFGHNHGHSGHNHGWSW